MTCLEHIVQTYSSADAFCPSRGKSFKSWLIFVNHLPRKFGTHGDKTNGYFMEQVEAEIDNLRTSVFELKSSLYRADRARMQYQDASGIPPWLNATATCFLALFFLLI